MVRRTYKEIDACLMSGLRQHTGTCWFNSALNGLILGYCSRKILRAMVKEYKSKNKIPDIPEDYCPRQIDGTFIISLINKLLCKRYFNPTHDVSYLAHQSVNAQTAVPGKPGGYPRVAFDGITKALELKYARIAYSSLRDASPVSIPNDTDNPLDIPEYVMVTKSLKSFNPFGPGMNDAPTLPDEVSIDVGNGNVEIYELDHCILEFHYQGNEGTVMAHAICGAFCRNIPVIYDSNTNRIVDYDWTVLSEDIPNDIERYNIDSSMGLKYSYIVYVRKALVDYIDDRPHIQLCLGSPDEYRLEQYDNDSVALSKDNKIIALLQPQAFPAIMPFVGKAIQARAYPLRGDTTKLVIGDGNGNGSVNLVVKNGLIYAVGPREQEIMIGKIMDVPLR